MRKCDKCGDVTKSLELVHLDMDDPTPLLIAQTNIIGIDLCDKCQSELDGVTHRWLRDDAKVREGGKEK